MVAIGNGPNMVVDGGGYPCSPAITPEVTPIPGGTLTTVRAPIPDPVSRPVVPDLGQELVAQGFNDTVRMFTRLRLKQLNPGMVGLYEGELNGLTQQFKER